MSRQHILAVPYPAQGHVIPMLELSQCLVKHGFRVTFVNTEHTHNRIMKNLQEKNSIESENEIHLASVPDGLEPWEDRNNLSKVMEITCKVMSEKLEELIEKINREEDEKIICVIVDGSAGFTIPVAEKLKIRKVAFWPAAVASLALFYNIPKLIDDGITDKDGKS